MFEYAIFNYGLRLGVGSGQYHRKQKSHWMAWFGIWVSSIMDMAVCNSALCDVWMKTSENRLLMMQKLVVLSSFSIFSIMNVELLWNYWGISNCIDIKCIEWIDLWSVGLQIWICVYVILQYVIFEWKLCFDHELKIEKMPVSGLFCVFKLRIHGSFGIHNWLATLYTHPNATIYRRSYYCQAIL